jgi:hypothetical protein
VIAAETSENCHNEIRIERGKYFEYCEERTWACEAEESPLLETVARK